MWCFQIKLYIPQRCSVGFADFLHIKSKYLYIFYLHARAFPYFITQGLEVSSKQMHQLSCCETLAVHKELGSKYFWKSQENPQDIFIHFRQEKTYFMNKYSSNNSLTAGDANLEKKIKGIRRFKKKLILPQKKKRPLRSDSSKIKLHIKQIAPLIYPKVLTFPGKRAWQ